MAVKLNLSRLSDHYLAALRIHLAEGARARLEPAWLLGREAVVLGLATPELARIHKRALAALELPRTKNATLKRAEKFFSEVNSCLKVTQRAARPGTVHGSPFGGVPSHRLCGHRSGVNAALRVKQNLRRRTIQPEPKLPCSCVRE